jgi:kynurenine formamidase
MFRNVKFVDLTHTVSEEMPTWSGSCGFQHEIKKDYDGGLRVLKYTMHAAAGTHIDAPSHFYKEGKNIADFTLDELIVPCCVIDVAKKRKADLVIECSDLKLYEESYGKIPKGSCVIGFTGWQDFWKEPNKYRQLGHDGRLCFPTFSQESAEFLLDRDVVGIGIDTFSPDPADTGYPVHHLLLGAGKYILENLCQLHLLPKKGGYLFALPMKIGIGTEACVRCIAAISKGETHG